MLLKKLTEAFGVSGDESNVRHILRADLENHVEEITTDTIGNLYVKKGIGKKPRVMLAAHMDEVGLIVTNIDSDGFIKFEAVGGIDQRVLNSKPVLVGEKKIPGVIGSKAIHLMSSDEKEKALPIDKMYIDIGTSSKSETEKLVNIGDYVSFKSSYAEFGDNLIKAKALDDRTGCSIILELLSQKLDADFYGVFTVMEEVGLRGAETAAYQLEPDLGLVLEGTVCADMPEVEEHDKSTLIGKGAALSLMDNTTVYDIDLVRSIAKIAEDNNIMYQYRKSAAGGNDAGVIHKTKNGAKAAAISVPCRYIHSPVSVASKKDIESVLLLTKLVILENQKGEKHV